MCALQRRCGIGLRCWVVMPGKNQPSLHQHKHIICPSQSQPPLGDTALITHASPSALVIGLLCPAQRRSETYITVHIVAPTLINMHKHARLSRLHKHIQGMFDFPFFLIRKLAVSKATIKEKY